MVSNARFLRWMMGLQLLAVMTVVFNHLSLSLLKLTPPVFSNEVYAQPALWGINFLFLSSGLLVHWLHERQFPVQTGWLANTANYIARRFLFLAVPCWAVYFFDVFVLSYKDFGPSPILAQAAASLTTLSQTWIYAIVGGTSLGQPLNASNMAWLGSCLLLLGVFYAVTRAGWARLGGWVALVLMVLFAALQGLQYWALDTYQTELVAYGTERYGTLPAGYTLWAYFFEYSPYAHLATFLTGVAFAQALRAGMFRTDTTWFVLAILGILLSALGTSSPTKFLGLNLIVIGVLIYLCSQPVTAAGPAPSQLRMILRGLVTRLSPAAYAIWTLHLAMQLPFISTALDTSLLGVKLYLVARVLFMTGMMLMMCYGFAILIFEPVRRHLLGWLHLEDSDDRFI